MEAANHGSSRVARYHFWGGVGCMTVDQAQDVDAMRDVAVRLSYMIGHKTLQEISPGALGERDWNVWYARVTVDSGDVGTIQLTARLALDPAAVLLPEEDHDVPTEFSKIERKTLALAAHKMATTGSAESRSAVPSVSQGRTRSRRRFGQVPEAM